MPPHSPKVNNLVPTTKLREQVVTPQPYAESQHAPQYYSSKNSSTKVPQLQAENSIQPGGPYYQPIQNVHHSTKNSSSKVNLLSGSEAGTSATSQQPRYGSSSEKRHLSDKERGTSSRNINRPPITQGVKPRTRQSMQSEDGKQNMQQSNSIRSLKDRSSGMPSSGSQQNSSGSSGKNQQQPPQTNFFQRETRDSSNAAPRSDSRGPGSQFTGQSQRNGFVPFDKSDLSNMQRRSQQNFLPPSGSQGGGSQQEIKKQFSVTTTRNFMRSNSQTAEQSRIAPKAPSQGVRVSSQQRPTTTSQNPLLPPAIQLSSQQNLAP